MVKNLCLALILGSFLAATPVRAQGTSSSTAGSSESWTDVGTVTMKGLVGLLTLDIDSVMVREVRFSFPDTSSYRIGKLTVWHGPDRKPWPLDFVAAEPTPKSPRTIRLRKPVAARKLQFLYSNIVHVDATDVHILVR